MAGCPDRLNGCVQRSMIERTASVPPFTGTVAAPIGGAGTATGYRIYTSTNGYGFDDAVAVTGTSHTFAGLGGVGGPVYFRVVATNAGGHSLPSEVVVARPEAGRRAGMLLVNGFDRLDAAGNQRGTYPINGAGGSSATIDRVRQRYQNTRDYVIQAAESIEAYDASLMDQVLASLQAVGEEKSQETKWFSLNALAASIPNILSTAAAGLALALYWVMSKYQALLYTFWYLIGPVLLPFWLFPPFRGVAERWFASLLGASFMGVVGALMFVLMAKAQTELLAQERNEVATELRARPADPEVV